MIYCESVDRLLLKGWLWSNKPYLTSDYKHHSKLCENDVEQIVFEIIMYAVEKDIMEITELKNYGKSLNEMMIDVPEEVGKKISREIFKVINGRLSSSHQEQFRVLTGKEKERMSKQDFSSLHGKGIDDEQFINSQVTFASSYSAMLKIAGREKTDDIFQEIAKAYGEKLFPVTFPRPEDFKKFDDPFNTFKEWFLQIVYADTREGIHLYDIIENTEKALQTNCIYCAWYEIHELLGVKKACIPLCNSDDFYFPDFCRQLGIRFIRKTTIAKGGDYCDFRFERLKN